MAIYQSHIHYEHTQRSAQAKDTSRKIGQSILSGLQAMWQRLVIHLTDDSSLQVWQSVDRTGTTWWHVHDPLTNISTKLLSEADVRIWIEERYYHEVDRQF